MPWTSTRINILNIVKKKLKLATTTTKLHKLYTTANFDMLKTQKKRGCYNHQIFSVNFYGNNY